uniref:hypothetical protein n=1 Tax=uncultured Lactobacillus sp. TaxID=153152 RepID=UPI0026033BDD
GTIDVALTNDRSKNQNFKTDILVTRASEMAIIQKGIFEKYAQIVELNDLKANACILICKIAEQEAEYDYYRNVLNISNQLIAVDSVNEAVLMAESGSGFFLMNESNAHLIKSESLQKLFLFNNHSQVKEDYVLLSKNESQDITEFSELLKAEF